MQFAGQLSRGVRDVVDDVPGRRLVGAEPGRLPVPPLLRQLARQLRIEAEREHAVVSDTPALREFGRIDDHEQVRMFTLGLAEVLGPVQPQ